MRSAPQQRNWRPKVLHVIDSLDISGGAEKQLAANLRHFDRDLLAHEVAVIKETRNTRVDEVGELVTLHQLIPIGSTPSRHRVISALRKLSSARGPDLIHASLPDSSLAARVVARLDGVAAVESLVNISHERVRTVDNPRVTRTKLRAHTLIDRRTMRSLLGFHAVSQAVADSWVATVGIDPRKIEVIPRGVDLRSFQVARDEISRSDGRRSINEEFGLPDDSLLVIAVGRVEAQKGHRYLVEAMALLRNSHPHIRVLIIGRPGNASRAVEKRISEMGLTSIVKMVGARRDVPRFLIAADVFAFPSLFEGNGGNAMIEAMAAGLPVITTGHPPMTDLIPDRDVGLLVERCDPDGLAAAMSTLADDEALRSRLGRMARQRAEGFASPEEVAIRHETWYLNLLSTHRGAKG